MEKDALIKEVQNYIAHGETEKAIQKLLNQLAELDADLYQQILVLSGRFSKLKREKNLGLNPTENENEILHAIVEMIDELKDKHAGVLKKEPAAASEEGPPLSSAPEVSAPSIAARRILLIAAAGVVALVGGYFLIRGGGSDDSGFTDIMDKAEVRFFTGGQCGEETSFASSFSHEAAKNINFCLELTYQEIEYPWDLYIEIIYSFPDGREEVVETGEYLLHAGSDHSFYSGKQLGTRGISLPAGLYHVEVRIDEEWAAEGEFRIE